LGLSSIASGRYLSSDGRELEKRRKIVRVESRKGRLKTLSGKGNVRPGSECLKCDQGIKTLAHAGGCTQKGKENYKGREIVKHLEIDRKSVIHFSRLQNSSKLVEGKGNVKRCRTRDKKNWMGDSLSKGTTERT